MINQDHVVAFAPTTRGRVLFTTEGAFIGTPISSRFNDPIAESLRAGYPVLFDEDQKHSVLTKDKTVVMEATFLGPAGKVNRLPELRDKLPGTVNFLVGNKEDWLTNLETWAEIVYPEVWPGIDVVFRASAESIEYRIEIEAGADPDFVLFNTGATRLEKLATGQILAERDGVMLSLSAPLATAEGLDIGVEFSLHDDGQYGFELARCEPSARVVVSSNLTWSTYLGTDGGYSDAGHDIAMDPDGHIYIVGTTANGDFPTTAGSFDVIFNQLGDAFVTKLNPGGSDLVYSTYLGGSSDDSGFGIAADSFGSAYVTGVTASSDFPVTPGSYNTTYSGNLDIFVTKLSSDGSSLVHSTFLGGFDNDFAESIAVDTTGACYITGHTWSFNSYPSTPGAFDETPFGVDAILTKLNSTGTALVYSTFLGGWSFDQGIAVAVDDDGNAFVTGETRSTNFPVTDGVYGPWGLGGGSDIFVTKVDPTGSYLEYSTYVSSQYPESPSSIALDDLGNAYVTGEVSSQSSFPSPNDIKTPPALALSPSLPINTNGFAFKLNSLGSDLDYFVLLGGSEDDVGHGVVVDGAGNAFVSGTTESSDFPTTAGSFDTSFSGFIEAFVAKINPTGTILFSTFLGGSAGEHGNGIKVDNLGCAVIMGETYSVDFPTTPGAFDQSHNGTWDVFITKLNATGSDLVFSTFLGGSGSDTSRCLAIDPSGDLYLSGSTRSGTFPTSSGAYDESLNGESDIFVTKVDASGVFLEYSTFLGGSSWDSANAIAVDDSGHAYLSGETGSVNFPTTIGCLDDSFNGNSDAFVAKLNPAGNDLIYSTYLGGSTTDVALGIAVDNNNATYITGHTRSPNFPTTVGAYDVMFGGYQDAFVTKLDPTGNDLNFSTYIGGTLDDQGRAICVDGAGNAFLTGTTQSSDFPTTPGAFDQIRDGYSSAFVSKLNQDGTDLSLSTLIDSPGGEQGYAIKRDDAGSIYVAGTTTGEDFPVSPGAFDETFNGDIDGFVCKLNATGSELIFGSYMGGTLRDMVLGLAIDQEGYVYVTGYTASPNFPTSAGGLESVLNGGKDAFVTRLDPSGSEISYSTYLGGSQDDTGYAVLVDIQNNTYITGSTFSIDFPTTTGSHNETSYGGVKGFLTKICPTPSPPSRVFGPRLLCSQTMGVGYSIETVPGATSYSWSVPPDAVIVSGQGTNSIIVDFGLQFGDISVTSNTECGSSKPTKLPVFFPPLWMNLGSTAQGLSPLVFEGVVCDVNVNEVQWTNLTDVFSYDLNQNPITVEPLLTVNSVFEFRATDTLTPSTTLETFPVLVHHFLNFDWNGDSCNTMQDLWDAAQFWRSSYPLDPNDDGFIDIRDFLYINTTSGCL